MTERGLLAAARAGDEDAFARLVAAHRAGLHAHCYRMLGSVQDAEDALQETLLRAWRGLARFEGRSSLRSWLYAIATKLLPPKQRAVLILRDVLGFTGGEVAEALETTPASVYSALQRAHRTVEERLPERSQQATLRSLGDEGVRAIVRDFVEAWERSDVEAVVSMLARDAVVAMPPIPTWYRGREAVAAFLCERPLGGGRRWRAIPTRANGQLAFGHYLWDDEAGVFTPHGVAVVTLRGDRIAELTIFRSPAVFARFGLPAAIAA